MTPLKVLDACQDSVFPVPRAEAAQLAAVALACGSPVGSSQWDLLMDDGSHRTQENPRF